MRHRSKPYQLFPRETKRRRHGKPVVVWYYRLWDGDKRSTAHSTGLEVRSAAESYVSKELHKGKLSSRKDPIFKDHTALWWKWGECPYVQGRRARGHSIGQSYVEACRGYLDRHVLPAIGHLHISQITPRHIENLVMDLREKKSVRGEVLSPTTVNRILASLKIIFSAGVRLGQLTDDPTKTIGPLQETPRERAFLTPQEVRKLLNPRTIGKVWNSEQPMDCPAASRSDAGERRGGRRGGD
jgi:hypothetical protein